MAFTCSLFWGGSLNNPYNVDKEMVLLDREPIARDLTRFDPEYTFRKCNHSDNLRSNAVGYCGWKKFQIKRGDARKKHHSSDPCYRAEVSRYDLNSLEDRFIDLEGQKFAVWRSKIPVPVFGSLDEYFEKNKPER